MEEKDLLKLKKQIDEAKSEVQQLKGRKEYLIQQLKKDWDCEGLEQAEKKLDEYKKEVEELENRIFKQTNELKQKYEFGED